MTAEIITVAAKKGGVGKSTTSRYLAAAAAKALGQDASVLLVDMDPQLSTYKSLTAAFDDDPGLEERATFAYTDYDPDKLDVQSFLRQVNAMGVDVAIVDTAPGSGFEEYTVPLALASDHVVSPCPPDLENVSQITTTCKEIPNARVLVTRATGTRKSTASSLDVIQRLGLPHYETVIPEKAFYSSSEPRGGGFGMWPRITRDSIDYARLWREMHGGQAANVFAWWK